MASSKYKEKELNEDGEEIGYLYICRDVPGVHNPGPDCWCCPLEIREDDPRPLNEIIEEILRNNTKQ